VGSNREHTHRQTHTQTLFIYIYRRQLCHQFRGREVTEFVRNIDMTIGKNHQQCHHAILVSLRKISLMYKFVLSWLPRVSRKILTEKKKNKRHHITFPTCINHQLPLGTTCLIQPGLHLGLCNRLFIQETCRFQPPTSSRPRSKNIQVKKTHSDQNARVPKHGGKSISLRSCYSETCE
jgi:hypothetical protein